MTFKIAKIITRHVLTHGKDFALVELSYEGERPGFDGEAHRYGTIEWGQERVCLAEVATAPSIQEALAHRESFEEMEALFDKYGRDPETIMRNPDFIREVKALAGRAR